MKRFLLACFLLTATCTVISVQSVTAQTTPPPVTKTAFMAEVTAMDNYIGAGNLTAAQTTWESIHTDMMHILGVTKASLSNATTPADKTYYTNYGNNQRTIYAAIWALHTDLVTNRAALNTKLTSFGSTIY